MSEAKTTTKRGSQARELLARARLAAVIAGQAKLAEQMLSRDLKPSRRREIERRLVTAYEAIRGPGWRGATGARAVVQVLELAAAHADKRSLEWAVNHAIEGIRGVLNDDDAPPEWAGREPDAKLVRLAIGALRRGRPGKPRKGDGKGSANEAIAAVLLQIGLSGAGKGGVKKLRARRTRR